VGPAEGAVLSTSVGEGTQDEIRQGVDAYLADSGKVWIYLSPLVSHGPLMLRGALESNTISGIWAQRSGDFPHAPHGPFVMYRRGACEPRRS
jgi:hypothetical protein